MRKMYCVVAFVALACDASPTAPVGSVAPLLSATTCQATPDTAFVDRSYSADAGNYVEADQCGNLIIDGTVVISSVDANAAGVPAQLANESEFQSIVLAPVATFEFDTELALNTGYNDTTYEYYGDKNSFCNYTSYAFNEARKAYNSAWSDFWEEVIQLDFFGQGIDDAAGEMTTQLDRMNTHKTNWVNAGC